jgi:hypothetical protein
LHPCSSASSGADSGFAPTPSTRSQSSASATGVRPRCDALTIAPAFSLALLRPFGASRHLASQHRLGLASIRRRYARSPHFISISSIGTGTTSAPSAPTPAHEAAVLAPVHTHTIRPTSRANAPAAFAANKPRDSPSLDAAAVIQLACRTSATSTASRHPVRYYSALRSLAA